MSNRFNSLRPMENKAASHVYFMHLPKTAGTSVLRHTERFFSAREIMAPVAPETYLRTSPQSLVEKKLISGHVGLLPVIFEHGNRFCYTNLRDPLARFESFLNHWMNDPSAYKLTDDNSTPPIEEALDLPEFCKRLMWYSYTYELSVGELPVLRYDPANVEATKRMPTVAEAEAKASQILDKLTIITDEKLHDAMNAFTRLYSASNIQDGLRVANRAHSKAFLSLEARKKLENLLQPDIRLYQKAQLASPTFETKPSLPPRVLLSYDFEKPFVGRGWSAREVPSNGWSEYGRYFDINGAEVPFYTQGEAHITASFLMWFRDNRAAQNLRVWVNDVPITPYWTYLSPFDHHAARYVVRFPAPHSGRCIVRFGFDSAFLANIDPAQHRFSDYGMDALGFCFWLYVTGQRDLLNNINTL